MDKEEKKKYEKPKVTRIKLDAKTAVLGVCKTAGVGGPASPGCGRFRLHVWIPGLNTFLLNLRSIFFPRNHGQ
jgi:hypothetical protein